MLSGMTDLHRELERRVAKFLGREDAMLFNSGFGGALGTISGLLRKTDVAILDNRSHLSLRDGAVLSRCRTEKFEHNDPVSLDTALTRQKGRRQLDRKSTRLNSSHLVISYAVFCLKKKNSKLHVLHRRQHP